MTDEFHVIFDDPVEDAMTDWSRDHFARMKDGGTWAVKRSGLIFQRRGRTLVLTARMPHDPNMPINAEQLDVQQKREYANIKRHFEAVGITVIWSTQ